jgi:hypothetical protein
LVKLYACFPESDTEDAILLATRNGAAAAVADSRSARNSSKRALYDPTMRCIRTWGEDGQAPSLFRDSFLSVFSWNCGLIELFQSVAVYNELA